MFSQCLVDTRRLLGVIVSKTFTQHGTGKMFKCQQQTQRLYSKAKKNKLTITVDEATKYWTNKFTVTNVPEPVESIEYLLAHVLGVRTTSKLADMHKYKLSNKQYQKLHILCSYRLDRMPIQYIIKQWDFWNFTIKVAPPIFIPRPETEILVHYVLKAIQVYPSSKINILDIGCGSGAISLALAHHSKKVNCVTAVDVNPEACNLTIENRNKLNLQNNIAVMHAKLKDDGSFEVLNVLNEYNGRDINSETFDFIVSNPPYIPTEQLAALPPEIKNYEDFTALDGGDDGLKVIKPLLKYAATALKPGGHLLLEVDTTHPEHIQCFIKQYPALKLKYQHTYKDICNIDRFVQISKLS